MKTMMNFVLETPQAIRKMISDTSNISEVLEYLINRKIDHIYVVGSGTSYSAALSCIDPLETMLHIPVYAYCAMEFVDNVKVIEENSLVIGFSQAGQSNSTIQALDKARNHGCLTIVVTAENPSPIVKHADACLKMDIEEAIGPKTKGYYCSTVEVILLFAQLLKFTNVISHTEYVRMISEILDVFDDFTNIVNKAQEWYLTSEIPFDQYDNIIVIGCDQCVPPALEGALKILETVKCCVRYYELEEFMHGIYHAIDDKTLVIALGNQSRHLDRMIRLLKYLKEHKNACCLLITGSEADILSFKYSFKDSNPYVSFEYLAVLQVFAECMMKQRGMNLNDPSDRNFHRYMNSYVYEEGEEK